MDHPTHQKGEQTDLLSAAAPASRRTRHLRGALAATTSVGLLFGAGTAVAGASAATAPGTHEATHTRAAFRHDHARNAGKVTSVDGTSAAGACGTAGGSGALVVTTFKSATRTYDVTPSTTFVEPGVTSAGFNNVCVGDVVAVRPAHPHDPDGTGAKGSTGSSADTGSSGDTAGTGNTGAPGTTGLTARKVFIAPPTPTSVPPVTPTPAPTSRSTGSAPSAAVPPQQPLPNGSSGSRPVPTAGSAERRGIVTTKDPSSFDVAANGQTQVVDVTGTTKYVGPGGPTTYGSVAVGDAVRVSGTDVNGAFTATTVDVFGAPSTSTPGPQPGTAGGSGPSPTPQPGPSPVPGATGFPARPSPAPVTPSPSGPGGQSGFGQGQSPQGQGFSPDGAAAGGTDGFGR